MAKKFHIETKTIDGFEITYESEEGQAFAVGYCPICGNKEESMQQRVDAGKITVGKLKVHMKLKHPELDEAENESKSDKT